MKNFRQTFSILTLILMSIGFSNSVFSQTVSYSPAPAAGIISICEGGEIVVTVNGTVSLEQYQLYLQPDNTLLETVNATSATVVFTPVTLNVSKSLQVFRTSPTFSSLSFQSITVVVDPTATSLTLSQSEGSVCAGSDIIAYQNIAGSGGVAGSDNTYEFRLNGGAWSSYTLGSAISTTQFMLSSVDIRAERSHPDGLGCYAENVYSWDIESNVHDNSGAMKGSYCSIQQAIDAASTEPGDELIVEAGTYMEEINLNKAITINGANQGISAGAIPGARGAESIVNGGFIVSAAATLNGLQIINGRTSGGFKVGVAVATSGVNVTNCIIEDVLSMPQSDGLSTQTGNNNLTLTNSKIANNWRGIYLNPGSGHTITGNLIDANNGVGLGIRSDGQSNLTLTGNIISNHTLEGWGASAVGTGVTAINNTFTNNGKSIAHYSGEPIIATCSNFGSNTYSDLYGDVTGAVVFVPYNESPANSCTGTNALPTSLALTYNSASENILVQFDVTNNDLELKPIPGLDPTVPAQYDQIVALYGALEAALLGGDPATIQAAALAVGDDIITEYYYYTDEANMTGKTYLKTAGNNDLIKNKYWQGYLVRSSDSENFPDWANNVTLVDQSEYQTSTNPMTGAVANGWLSQALGKTLHVDVTFIHNGNVTTETASIALPLGPVNVYSDEPLTAENRVSSHFAIQSAIDAVTTLDGYIVTVDAGVYTENATTSTGLNTGKRLSFTGATDMSGEPVSIIEGSLYLNDNDAQTITNIRFKSDGAASNHLVQLKNTNGLTFTNCVFDGDGNLAEVVNGINHISGPNGNSDIVVEDSKFLNGIYVGISSRFTGLTVKNTLFDNIKSGINHQSANNVLVDDCTFNLNGGASYGVRFASTDAANNLTITNCAFNIPLTGNTAIWMRSGAGGTMLVENNSIIAEMSMLNESVNPVNAECNWWGSAVAATVSSVISGNVDYTPWLTSGSNDAAGYGFFQTTLVCGGTPVVIASAVPTDRLYCTDGNILVTFSGGEGQYDIDWGTGSDTDIVSPYPITNLPAGAYNITITDSNGSTATAMATILNFPVRNSAIPAHYATIQAAIDAASDNDNIELCAGTYTENATTSTGLNTGKRLSFTGATDMSGAPISIINGSLYLNDNDVQTITNVRFKSDGVASNHLVQLKNTNGLTFTNCIFDGDNNLAEVVNGINHISGPNGNSDIVVEDSKFLNGIYVGISSRFTGLTVKNTLFDNIKSGINHQSANNVLVDDCTFNLNGGASYGVRFASTDAANNLTVRGSLFNIPLTGNVAIWMRSGAGGTMLVENNSIIAEMSMLNESVNPVNAECNWWGSAIAANVASVISGNVTVAPWLVSGTDASGDPGFQPSAPCSPVVINSAVPTNILCGPTTGSILVTFSGGNAPIDIAWTEGSATNVTSPYNITPLTAGTYGITVTSLNGSSATTTVDVLYLPVHNTTANTYHATIQAAIDAAADEDDIFLCAGTYTENATTSTGLNTGKRLSFTGATDMSGAPISIINGSLYLNDNDVQTITNVRFKSDGVASNHLVQLKNTNGLTFTNCIFDGDNNLADVVNGINHISGPNGNSDIVVEDSKFINGIYVGISSRFTGLTVQNTLFEDIKSGINHLGANNVLVEDCTFNLNGGSSYGVRFASDAALNLTVRNSDFNIPNTDNTAIWLRAAAGGTILVENNSIIASTQIFNESTVLVNAPCNWWGSGTAMGVKAIVEDPAKVSGNVKVASYLVGNGNSTPALGFTPTDACVPAPVRLYTDLTNTTLSDAFFKIQNAVNAATGSQLIEVGSGTYEEFNINVNKSVTILGANAGVACSGGRGSESIIQNLANNGLPVINVTVDGVTLNGFEIINPWGNSAVDGSGRSNLSIIFNKIHNVGTSRGSGNIYGVRYLVGSTTSSDVTISDNCISNVANTTIALGNSGGLWFGQSDSDGTLSSLTIERNTISDINAASTKGAWGITVGTGSAAAGSIAAPVIRYNSISAITGGYSSAIDLTGKTPNAVITNNFIDNINSSGVTPSSAGVTVGAANTGSTSLDINDNSFTDVLYGITNANAGTVNGTCNWYGSASGNVVAPKILGNVNYISWLVNGTNNVSGTGFFQTTPDCSGTPVVASATPTNEICGVLGSIEVIYSGGSEDYTISWSGTETGSAVDPDDVTPFIIPDLSAGNYTITVTDANGSFAVFGPVSVQYLPVHNTTANTYHPTIQAAIDAASDNQVISLCAGTYSENATTSTGLNTGKRLSFVGATNMSGEPLSIIEGSLYLNDNDGRSVTSVRFKSNGVASNHLVQLKNTNGLIFTNCVFDGDGDLAQVINGINHISGPNGNSDILVDDCKFIDGIYVGISSRITGLTVQNTLFEDIKSGINHLGANNVLVEDCTFNLNGGSSYGVRFASDAALNLTVRNSDFNIPNTDNTAIWLRAAAGGTILVENNSIIASTQIFNESTVLVNAPCNWWGSGTAMGVKAIVEDPAKVSGNVKVASYLVGNGNSTPALGFTPTDACTPAPVRLYTDLTNTTLSDAFFKIQPAVNAATGAQLIEVGAGTYVENVVVHKSLTINGPNSAISPNTGTRVGEAIVYPATSQSDAIFLIEANNVAIKGFIINGDNPSINTGWAGTNMADIDAFDGIGIYDPANVISVSGSQIENNIIENLVYFGVDNFGWYNYNNPATTGHIIKDNLFRNLGTYGTGSGYDFWGGGVLLYNDNYTSIVDNVMTNVRIGIQTGNFHKANPGGNLFQQINNNTIQARRMGVFYNLHTGPSVAPLTFDGNNITALANANETRWRGFVFSSLSDAIGTASGNIIDGSGITIPSVGYEIWNVKENAPAEINGGQISNVDTGVFANNFEGYSSDAGNGAHATITGPMTITPNAAGIGVRLLDSPSSTTHGKVNATVTGVTIGGGSEGIKLEQTTAVGAAVGGSFTGNTISAAAVGINVTRATLSSTNALTISDNNITNASQLASGNPTVGISLTNLSGSSAATVSNNDIAGPFYGYVGYNINTTSVTTISGGTVSGIMQGAAIVNTVGGPLEGSSVGINGVTISGFTGISPTPANNFHAGVYTFTANGTTISKGLNLTVNNVNITGTGVPSQASGGIYLADFSGGSDFVQTVNVNTSIINNNSNRGIDARGKVNLTLTGNTISNNGYNAFASGGNEGFSVIAQQNAQITANNNFITLPAISTTRAFGLFTGNGSTNQITANNNSILLNGNNVAGSKSANSDSGTGSIDATCNWWDICPAGFISGNVAAYPYLTSGVDGNMAAGFQPSVACDVNGPSIVGTVSSPVGGFSVTLTSGASSAHTICSGQEVQTTPPTVVYPNTASCSSLRVRTEYISTLPNIPSATVDLSYAVASASPITTITPENHTGELKTITFYTTAYYELDGVPGLTGGDVAGEVTTFVLTVLPRPIISNKIFNSSNVEIFELVSGDDEDYAQCHNTNITTSAPMLEFTQDAACGVLRIQTEYISTLPNISSAVLDASYDDALAAGPQTISPNNTTGSTQTIEFLTTPYYEVDGDPGLTSGDIAGEVTRFVLTVHPIPTGAISGTATVQQNDPIVPVITFTGAVGTGPYTFAYIVNDGVMDSPTQYVTSVNNVVTVAQDNSVLGTFTYTLLSVTDANGCAATIISNPAIAVIQVVPSGQYVDLAPAVARPQNGAFNPNQMKQGYVQFTNGGNANTAGPMTFRIFKPSNFQLLIDNSSTVTLPGEGTVNVINADPGWTITWSPALGGHYLVTSSNVIPDGSNVKIGFTLTAGSSTFATGNMTVDIFPASGGDNNPANNTAVRQFVIN